MSELDAIIRNIYQGFAYELRIKHELTQIDLASLTGISVRTLGALESHDKLTVSRKVIQRLAKFYGYKDVLSFSNAAKAFNNGEPVKKKKIVPYIIGGLVILSFALGLLA